MLWFFLILGAYFAGAVLFVQQVLQSVRVMNMFLTDLTAALRKEGSAVVVHGEDLLDVHWMDCVPAACVWPVILVVETLRRRW